jgi:hypothetical protein
MGRGNRFESDECHIQLNGKSVTKKEKKFLTVASRPVKADLFLIQ